MQRTPSNDKPRAQGKPADESSNIQFPQGGWIQSNSKNYKRNCKRNYKKNYDLNSNLIQLVPASQNRFEVLANLKEDDAMGVLSKDDKIKFLNSCSHVKGVNQLARSVKTGDYKVVLIGDSHAKKCALDLRHNFDHNYEVSGFIKPEALSSEIIMMAEKEVSALKQEDVMILWAGANDISRNNSKYALRNLSCFMSANDEVNMIMINSLPRHDLMQTSCVNKEVNKFNRQLKKIIKLHGNVKLLNVEVQREHFTRQGQHLNNKGKKLVSLELSRLVKQCLKKKHPLLYKCNGRKRNLIFIIKFLKILNLSLIRIS